MKKADFLFAAESLQQDTRASQTSSTTDRPPTVHTPHRIRRPEPPQGGGPENSYSWFRTTDSHFGQPAPVLGNGAGLVELAGAGKTRTYVKIYLCGLVKTGDVIFVS